MELKTVTCDECGKVKLENDHWFKAISRPGHFAIWGFADDGGLADRDICSDFCAKNAMAKALRQESGHAGQSADVPQLCPACKETIWFGRLHLCVEVPRRRWHEQSETL